MHASDDIPEISEDGDSLPPEELRALNGIPVLNVYPFVAQILNKWTYDFCEGSLITGNYVLTAARCCSPEHILNYEVRYNTNRLDGGTMSNITTMIIHSGYSKADAVADGVALDDICVLRLATPASIGTYPALNENRYLYGGRFSFSLGYKKSENVCEETDDPFLFQLHRVTIPLVSETRCARTLFRSKMLRAAGRPKLICAGYSEVKSRLLRKQYVGKYPALRQEDYGSPLFLEEGKEGNYLQIGIASSAYDPETGYSTFSSVGAHRSWINGVMKECEDYLKSHPWAAGCPISPTTTVTSLAKSIPTSLILMIAALVPFVLF